MFNEGEEFTLEEIKLATGIGPASLLFNEAPLVSVLQRSANLNVASLLSM